MHCLKWFRGQVSFLSTNLVVAISPNLARHQGRDICETWLAWRQRVSVCASPWLSARDGGTWHLSVWTQFKGRSCHTYWCTAILCVNTTWCSMPVIMHKGGSRFAPTMNLYRMAEIRIGSINTKWKVELYIYSGTCQIEHLRTLNNFSCPGTLPLTINGRLPGYIEHLSTLNIEHQICSRSHI